MKTLTRLSLVTALFTLSAPAAFAGDDHAMDGMRHKAPKDGMHQMHEGPRPMAHFKEMDKNGDGAVTRDEFMPYRDARMDNADANKDGTVTYDEFVARAEARRAEMEAEMAKHRDEHYKKMFARLDANKDGKLSKADADADAKSAFDRADADKNGKITEEEMKGAYKRRMMEMREEMRGKAGEMRAKADEMRAKAEEMKAQAKAPN